MEKLLQGLIRFRKEDFEKHKELFGQLEKQQSPHTLFIGCSDSRLVPNLITQTLPGELFVVRNIANIVPPYRKSEEHLATTSAIEYAINVLDVQNIVVCGHSNCGGCHAIYASDDLLSQIPHTRKWLELAEDVKKRVLDELHEEDEQTREWMTEQINVVEQLKHLLTYPFIRDKYKTSEIEIHGWYYVIETGEVYIYNKENGKFEVD
ncbi:MAG: carbonic anhydrase [Peptococcaceae bacterium]|nr:carbonic anhydrase [Peptococcaceae bacterium]